MKLLRIDHVQLAMPAGQEERAREFYGGVLGLSEVAKPAALVARGGVWFEAEGLKVHLGVDPDFVPARKAHPAFVVDDLVKTVEWIQSNGLEVSAPKKVQGRYRTFVHDPFGNRIELVDEGE